MINYLKSGKALYIEGADLLTDLAGSVLLSYLGCTASSDGVSYGNILSVTGTAGTVFEGFQFDYTSYGKADYLLDVIQPGDAALVLVDQNSNGRVSLLYAPEGYRVITSTLIFGALKDVNETSTKKILLARYLNFLTGTTGVDGHADNGRPSAFLVHQNYPNPFNGQTVIEYELFRESRIIIDIYDMLGRRLVTLFDSVMPEGRHRQAVHADGLPSGSIICRLQSDNHIQTVTMTVLK